VINDSLDYIPNLSDLLKKEKMLELEFNYHTVAIIGA
jgi:hypothetical protein